MFLTKPEDPYSLSYDPEDLIGRTFLLPSEENGERNRAKETRKVVEILDQEFGQRIENINFILDIGNGKVEELISYNQLLGNLETAQDNDKEVDQELFKFIAHWTSRSFESNRSRLEE